MTPLLLPVSQWACQPESRDQSPISASQPLKPAWQRAIINTRGERCPSSFGLNITYTFQWVSTTASAVRQALDRRMKAGRIWWLQEGDSSFSAAELTELIIAIAVWRHWQLNSAAVRAGGGYLVLSEERRIEISIFIVSWDSRQKEQRWCHF